MAETQHMTLEYLLRMRGDLAITSLESLRDKVGELYRTMDMVCSEIKNLDDHYQLTADGASPMKNVVDAIRKMKPEETANLTDADVMKLIASGG